MLRLEKKIIALVEKYMSALALVLISLLALYVRRQMIWWNDEHMPAAFDMHLNHIQSDGYYLLVRLVQYVPALPVHTVKWIAGLADFGVALLAVLLLGDIRQEPIKKLLCYSACVLSPVVFLRGAGFACIDSLAMCFLLAGCLFWRGGRRIPATVLAVCGIVLYPGYLLPVIAFLYIQGGKDVAGEKAGSVWIWCVVILVGSALLQGLCGLFLGEGFGEGLRTMISWTSYHPFTGELYQNALEWGIWMLCYFGYAIAVCLGLAGCRHRLPWMTVLLGHFGISVVYSSIFF